MESLKEYVLKECFSINLKWYRINKNYTQEQLAELSGLTPKYISDLERGKFSPSLEKIEAISKALGIDAYKLLMTDHINDHTNLENVRARKRKLIIIE